MAGSSLWENFFRPKGDRDVVSEHLANTVVFRDLGSRALRQIRELVHIRDYAKDDVVFFEGQPGSGMYTILSGAVRIVLNYGRDGETELVRLGPGDFFGELSLLDEAPRSATVVATGPTRLGGFFRPDLMDLVGRQPRIGVKILLNLSEVLSERLRRTNIELKAARDERNTLRARLDD